MNNMQKDFSDWWKRVNTTIKFPKEGTVFDYYCGDDGKFSPWEDIVAPYDPPEDAYLVTRVFVPTVDSTRQRFLMNTLVEIKRPVLLVGNAGTGKTVQVRRYLRELDEAIYISTNINLNFYTDAKALQLILEGPIDKRSGRTYGPPIPKKLIYFIDDLNMPKVDTYGTQSPSALIRQHMDYGCWYDTTKLERKEIQGVQYIACMNPTSGSFQVNDRLQAQFATFACQMPNEAVQKQIYGKVMAHHLQAFSEPIKQMCNGLVDATIDLRRAVADKFLPSTKKFHYQFNLRDMSSVFQGLCLSHPKKKFTPAMMVDLWEHETTRVFSDRLVSPEDEEEYRGLLDVRSKKHFKEIVDPPGGGGNKSEDPVEEDLKPIKVWTSFVSSDSAYLPVQNFRTLKKVLVAKLEAYNESNAVMPLELFGMAMQHVCRIARIIENPNGNALLVGVGGSGKQSLARLAAFICGYDTFQITVHQDYKKTDLKVDLQELYMKSGVKNVPICFLLTDTQIVDDSWLVYINDLLTTGFIPDLFSDEELDGILSQIRNAAKAHGVPDSKPAMMDFFLSTVRANLHVVLAFSPVTVNFRIRCRKFPGLINCTTIDWFHPWPRDALESVAFRFLEDIDIDEHRQAVSEHMASVHLSVTAASEEFRLIERKHNYTTPKSFLELIAYYKQCMDAKRADLQKQTARLTKGIETLQSTSKDVAALREALTKTLLEVSEKKTATDELIAVMGDERKKVEDQQAVAAVEAQKAKSVSDVASQIAEECTRDLEAALPIMERAKLAVQGLDKASLTTLKSFTTPPPPCVEVTKAVMILKNYPGKRDWANAKKMMGNIGKFLQDLIDFDATNIDESTVAKLKPILAQDFFCRGAHEEVLCGGCKFVRVGCQHCSLQRNLQKCGS
jgi:dynein heavy chain